VDFTKVSYFRRYFLIILIADVFNALYDSHMPIDPRAFGLERGEEESDEHVDWHPEVMSRSALLDYLQRHPTPQDPSQKSQEQIDRERW